MHARYVRTAYQSTQGYVCLSCRVQADSISHKQLRRLQHTEASTPPESQDASNITSFSDRIRSFLAQKVDAEKKENTDTPPSTPTKIEPKVPQEPTSHLDIDLDNAPVEDKFHVLQQKYKRKHEAQAALMAGQTREVEKGSEGLSGKVQSKALTHPRHRRREQRRLYLESQKASKSQNAIASTASASPKIGSNANSGNGSKEEVELSSATPSSDQDGESLTAGTLNIEEVQSRSAAKAATAQPQIIKSKVKKSSIRQVKALPEIKKAATKKEVKAEKKAPENQKSELVKKLASRIAITEASLKKKAGSNHVKPLTKGRSDLLEQQKALIDKPATEKSMLNTAKTTEKASTKTKGAVGKVGKVSPKEKKPKGLVYNRNVDRERLKSAIQKADASKLEIKPIAVEQPLVPQLAYGLERVLFNPGVYQLQDPRSRVFNFDPYLQKIMPVTEFNFNALKEYVTSSKDASLNRIAKQQSKRYVGSTSSMTSMLAHFHFLLSQWRPINTSMLSKDFPVEHKTFTEIQRCPSAIFLKWKDGSYAIDADKQFATANVLSMLGKSMEKLLTLPTDDYEKYRKSNPNQATEDDQTSPESFHYSSMGDFLMRSQLDAHDPRLPGTGMFDLKTRAVVSIRMDVQHFEQGVGYQIKERQGSYESYEREYYDMIRAAFLKYSMQVRMGRMDGIFVAFHNIERIFGFQYISLNEMDQTIHGQYDTTIGDQEFTLSLDLLNKILDRATKKYPETSLRLHFETRDAATPFMYIFAEPVTEDQVAQIQSHNDAKIEEFENSILGLSNPKAKPNSEAEFDNGWDDIQANVENAMNDDELGLNEIREGNVADSDGQLEEPSREELFAEGPLFSSSSTAQQDVRSAPVSYENADDDGKDIEEEKEDEGEDECEKDEKIKGSEGIEQTIDEDSEEEMAIAGAQLERPALETGQEKGREGASDPGSTNGEASMAKSNNETFGTTSVESSFKEDGGFEDDADTNEADAPFLEEIKPSEDGTRPILAMTLTLRNKVNDSFVLRPEKLKASDTWSIEYSLVDVPEQHRAWALYQACQVRRKRKLDAPMAADDAEKINYYAQNLRNMSVEGRKWRKKLDEQDKDQPVQVLGQDMQATTGGHSRKSGSVL